MDVQSGLGMARKGPVGATRFAQIGSATWHGIIGNNIATTTGIKHQLAESGGQALSRDNFNSILPSASYRVVVPRWFENDHV